MSAPLDWDGGWTAVHFEAFFRAVHGPAPFPWQRRLIARLLEGGGWPDELTLPTATGKTAAIDVALFHLAAELHRGGERRAPVRIALVVDRRLIVDDAHARAETIARALADPTREAEAIRRVAAALGKLAESPGRPLLVRRLRGGVPREDDWARTPAQPTVLTSTVDQVGSRLLFRGYGLTPSVAPIHAGLLGADCLILLDEVHLSRPFRQTLDAVVRSGRGGADSPVRPLRRVLMTATPAGASGPGRAFALDGDDLAHPVLAPRLTRPKPAALVEIRPSKGRAGAGDDAGGRAGEAAKRRAIEHDRVEAVCARVASALEHLGGPAGRIGGAPPVVGVVVNRVLRARAVYERLAAAYDVPAGDGEPGVRRVTLVIGPARGVDRERLVDRDLAPLKTGRGAAREALEGARIVVATQTIEAGVDLDFDGLVTEVAALDALRQRFGRLNRAGRDIEPYAAVLAHPGDDLKPKGDGDPLYGMAAAQTWEKLSGWHAGDGRVDFAHAAMAPRLAALSDAEQAALAAPGTDAPVVLPAYIDLWSQTAPVPASDPEPALFLHGPNRSDPTVRLVWRGDLTEGTLDRAGAVLDVAPVRGAEAVEISLAAARAWLSWRGSTPVDFADVPGRGGGEAATGRGRAAFRVDRGGGEVLRDPAALRPGDLLVVPATYGGCDRFGWRPESREPVPDVGEFAAWPYRGGRYAVRIGPARLQAASAADGPTGADARAAANSAAARWDTLAALLAEAATGGGGEEAQLRALLSAGLPESLRRLLAPLEHARRGPGRRLDVLAPYAPEDADAPYAGGVVIAARFGLTDAARLHADDGVAEAGEARVRAAGVPATEDDAVGSLDRVELDLVAHSRAVEDKARAFARACGLPEPLAADVALAGWLHDAGKADPRFQAVLGTGDPLLLAARSVLAKSGRRSAPGDWERAGLPPHWRHEALSVRLALENPRLSGAHDPGLVLWLVGTHHGRGRPLFPHGDPLDAEARVLPRLRELTAPLGPGRGPQSLGFGLEGAAFGDELRGLDWAQLFAALKRRYGAWGLAHLEAVLRLADHRASEGADA